MEWVATGFANLLEEFYLGITQILPSWAQTFLNLFLWSLLLVIYAIFIWKFYRWIARKDILKLNLSKFNSLDHAVFAKVFGMLIYFIEYLVILPIVVFLWFGGFTLFLMFLTNGLALLYLLLECWF